MGIFSDILACRSLTNIHFMAEDARATTTDPAQRKALQDIYETSRLDEVYAIAHEQLGHHEEAQKLRNWMAANKPRTLAERLADDALLLP